MQHVVKHSEAPTGWRLRCLRSLVVTSLVTRHPPGGSHCCPLAISISCWLSLADDPLCLSPVAAHIHPAPSGQRPPQSCHRTGEPAAFGRRPPGGGQNALATLRGAVTYSFPQTHSSHSRLPQIAQIMVVGGEPCCPSKGQGAWETLQAERWEQAMNCCSGVAP